MANSRPGTEDLHSYTIEGSDVVVQAGDRVLLRNADASDPPHVAIVERFQRDSEGDVQMLVRWYYRPEQSRLGRYSFHGAKEVFLSDRHDDYFCRFTYDAERGDFSPDRVYVYCKCDLPYNPDHFMLRCQDCEGLFHPACIRLTIQQAMELDHYLCDECDELVINEDNKPATPNIKEAAKRRRINDE